MQDLNIMQDLLSTTRDRRRRRLPDTRGITPLLGTTRLILPRMLRSTSMDTILGMKGMGFTKKERVRQARRALLRLLRPPGRPRLQWDRRHLQLGLRQLLLDLARPCQVHLRRAWSVHHRQV